MYSRVIQACSAALLALSLTVSSAAPGVAENLKPSASASGVIAARSAYGMDETVERLKKDIAVKGITFDVEQGEIFGLLGPNGAGKTTTLRMVLDLFKPDTGTIEVLPHMEQGKNVSPQWAPDGRSIAFVSDRNGVSNIFLYDFDAKDVYQLTDFYTGAQGITPLSPVLSWSHGADRLAFNYYENGKYDIYALDNPRAVNILDHDAVVRALAAQKPNWPPGSASETK